MAESAIALLNPSTGQRYAAAGADAVVLSSVRAGWHDHFTFEVHRMAPHAYDEHVLVGHRLIVNLGAPVRFGWRRGDKPQEATLATGGFCLQSEGDTNAPFWSDELTFAAVAIAPGLVETLLEDRAPKPTKTFAERRCLTEPAAVARRSRDRCCSDCPRNGSSGPTSGAPAASSEMFAMGEKELLCR